MCLHSIKKQSGISYEVFVVDNASKDDSPMLIKRDFPWIILIKNRENLGFAKANNKALKHSKGRYVYFLNPDTQVKEGAFETMVSFMDVHPEVGLAGSRLVNPDGSPQPSVEEHYPGERQARRDLSGLKGNIAWVMGASMIARKEILDRLGGFDERYFLYGEDQDLCLEIRKAGWIIGFIPEAVVVHWEGQSERNNLPKAVWKKKLDAEILFYKKHYSKRAIQSIKRLNRIKAVWRMITLNLALPFCREKSICLRKLEKYKIILESFNLDR